MSGVPLQAGRTNRASLLTPHGVGAVATIAFHGDPTLFDAAVNGRGFLPRNRFPLLEQKINRILFGTWGTDPVEEIVVCRLSPEEYEIHCHGGKMATARILEDLTSAGCTVEPWEKYLTRRDGAWEADFASALSRSETEGQLDAVLQQREAWMRLRDQVRRAANDTHRVVELLQGVLSHEAVACRLAHPCQLVLLGRPNVGKSSLLNTLLGFQRAIVHPEPGTTRDVVQGETAVAGWPVRLLDTAGVRKTSDEIETQGIERTMSSVAAADGLLLVLDGSTEMHDDDRELLRQHSQALVVLNKFDLPSQIGATIDGIPVSARTGHGLEVLLDRIARQFILPLTTDSAVPFSPRLRKKLSELLSLPDHQRNADWLRDCETLWEGLP